MFNISIYGPQGTEIILTNILVNLLIEGVFVVVLLWIWKQKRKLFLQALLLVVTCELFLFGRGNILTTNQEIFENDAIYPTFGINRYVTTSEVQDYVGPHIYWNHLRVRQPFAPDLTDEELKSFERLSKEISMLPGNINVIDNRYNASGYSAVVLESYAKYWDSDYVNSVSIKDINDYRLDLLGVKYIVTGYPDDYVQGTEHVLRIQLGEVSVYQNKQALERAFIKSGGTVEIQSYEPTRVRLNVLNQFSDSFTFTDSLYPGWKAYVDGTQTPIKPFEQAFRQIDLEPGNHQVEFRYQPDSVKIGALISGVFVILTSIILLWPQKTSSPLLFLIGMVKKIRLNV